jgi:hypothetical protein
MIIPAPERSQRPTGGKSQIHPGQRGAHTLKTIFPEIKFWLDDY